MTEKLRKFAFHYPLDGRSCALTIEANSPEEAIKRVKAMSQAVYDGEIFVTIYVPNQATYLARLMTSIRQFFR